MADAAQIVLNDTLGAAFIGVVVSGCLFGVSCIQAWYYFTHQSDRWPLKTLVAAVMVSDTIHQALISHTVYAYTITNWGNQSFLGEIPRYIVLCSYPPHPLTDSGYRTLVVQVLFSGLTAFMVQCFLASRIWRLSDRKGWLIAIIVLLIVGEFGAILGPPMRPSIIIQLLTEQKKIAYTIISLQFHTFSEVTRLKGLSLSVNSLAAIGDVFIAGSLCTILYRSRTGFHRSDTIITKLIIFSVNTGLLTSVCALGSLVSILAWPTTFIYIAFYFCIGRLYTNSLLATLNARKKLRELSDGIQNTSAMENVSVSLQSLGRGHASDFSSSQQRQNISIKIDTKKEFATDSGDDIEKLSVVNMVCRMPLHP
ncbi:uncharacterized protein LACBIDRAFT_310401 [Laccaria bicolor S238N-H82]|uniref:Predicted protein n=1 Tax=Laccaria bicolor (strain S238N-H82 / ATCC MYA-4686) TaxID=486041 RepID=B0DU94_LACBS|nr:uncharacterized protein LACBIDRAFT_310401 [Laccaria bicolor S238N-H82]EDR01864.1 predicted protein [Laccaria bicolor S238N-H82]|eukprot:XP_001887474.1 predicted protein [Laccaria bicolor S238N-H82]